MGARMTIVLESISPLDTEGRHLNAQLGSVASPDLGHSLAPGA